MNVSLKKSIPNSNLEKIKIQSQTYIYGNTACM